MGGFKTFSLSSTSYSVIDLTHGVVSLSSVLSLTIAPTVPIYGSVTNPTTTPLLTLSLDSNLVSLASTATSGSPQILLKPTVSMSGSAIDGVGSISLSGTIFAFGVTSGGAFNSTGGLVTNSFAGNMWVGGAVSISGPVSLSGGLAFTGPSTYLVKDRSMLLQMSTISQAFGWRPLAATVTVSSITVSNPTSTTSTQIPGSVYIGWSDPRFQYFGTASFSQRGPTYPNAMYGASYGNISASYDNSAADIPFYVSGQHFEVFTNNGPSSVMNIYVDGQVLNFDGVTLTASGAGAGAGAILMTEFTFPTSGTHKIEITNAQIFGGVRVENDEAFFVQDKRPLTMMWIGDSFGEGTGSEAGAAGAMGYLVSRKFGWAMCNSSAGSTGYVSETGTYGSYFRPNYIDRVIDVASVQPDIIVDQGSVNDGGSVTTTIAGLLYDTQATLAPGARIIAVAPPQRPDWASAQLPSLLAEKAAAQARGIPFIDTTGWFNSTNQPVMFQFGASFSASSALASNGWLSTFTITNGGTGWYVPVSEPLATNSFASTIGVSLIGGATIPITGTCSTGSSTITISTASLSVGDVVNGGNLPTNSVVTAVGTGTISINNANGNTFSSGLTFSGAVTATISSFSVAYIGVINGGNGYTTAPTVTISGGGVAGAVATASLSGTSLSGFNLVSGGSGYSVAPTVTISGGGGSSAAATASISGGAVTGFNITNAGTGYTSTPNVSISSNVATATASVSGGQVTTVSIVYGGNNYQWRPNVSFSSALGGNPGTPGTGQYSGAVASAFVGGSATGAYETAPGVYSAAPSLYLNVDNTHPNQNGHDWYAEEFSQALINALLR